MKTSNHTILNRKRIKLIAFVLFTISLTLFAQQDDTTESPYFLVLSDNPALDQLPLKANKVDVNITGVIADVTISQVYKNEGKNALEAIYTFPASTNAAVYAMEMTVGNRKIIAEIEEKKKAREKYEIAKSEGKRTSLLEQQKPNVFQMNVANIMAGDEITVQLKYTELLVPEDGEYQFVYPTVVGPRYTGESSNNNDYVNTAYQKAGELSHIDFDISVHLSTGIPIKNIESPSHDININYTKLNEAGIALAKGVKNGGNRDFIINYKLSGDKIETGLMLYEHNDENFFLLMVQPPKRVIAENIPDREYIFIVDVSGSMRGFPIDVTKKLMRNLITNLKPTDRFNVLVFAGNSGWLAAKSLPATMDNMDKAVYFIDNHKGSGGTNLLSAISKVQTLPRFSESLSRSYVIVTDGYVNVEKEAFDLIRNNCDNANTFSFGIGSSVNRYIIEGMAHMGQSEPLIVLNANAADKKADQFRTYINSPVLTQIKTNYHGFQSYDVEPISIPDVLAERPVIIYGKYKGQAHGKISINGYAGNKKYKQTIDVSKFQPHKSHSAIRYLWARKRIQILDDYYQLNYEPKIEQEVTQLGLNYNLMTAYTSFIAIEEDKTVNEQGLTSVKQVLPMPQGVPNSAVGFEMDLEEEEESYFFHSSVEIDATLSAGEKDNLTLRIESEIVTKINHCFGLCCSILESIEIVIDKHGKIIDLRFYGENISEELERCITEALKNENFKSYKLNQNWICTIHF
ncbi:MAG: VWA domain-containing protein [Bacteroidales bacterium]|nr:VWA domain-containing protein [Bacteroidales bacterium]